MPKKSTKSKSKRTTLKQKYKLIKKVKEHHKKKRREENRKKRLGIKPKAPKDPGIPAQWPYKDELMKEIDYEVEKKKELEEAKAEAKRERRAENKKRAREAMEAGLPAPTLEELRRRADASAEGSASAETSAAAGAAQARAARSWSTSTGPPAATQHRSGCRCSAATRCTSAAVVAAYAARTRSR